MSYNARILARSARKALRKSTLQPLGRALRRAYIANDSAEYQRLHQLIKWSVARLDEMDRKAQAGATNLHAPRCPKARGLRR
jgi:hypothetical protein